MRRRVWLVAVLGAGLLQFGIAPPRTAAARSCADGRFLVGPEPLLGDAAGLDALVIQGNRIALGTACRATPGSVRSRRGKISVKVNWRRCAAFAGPSRLRAVMDAQCRTITGTLTTRRPRLRRAFSAVRSTCGDGVLDTKASEQCEDRITAIGLRFPGLTVPPGSVVLSAYLQFRAAEAGAAPAALRIEADRSGDASPITGMFRDVTGRPRTAAAIAWSPGEWTMPGIAGPDERTPDIAALIQEVVDQPEWASGNAIAFVVSGSGVRVAFAYDGDADGAPLLHVEYIAPATAGASSATSRAVSASATTADPTTVALAVASGADDAEQHAAGNVSLTSDDLELGEDSGPRIVGIRFVDVPVPRGATILDAHLQFRAQTKSTSATSLRIEGELAEDAAPFAAVSEDLSRRTRTAAAVDWTPPPWPAAGVAGPDQRTPDLTAVVQEIVDGAGWTPGNSLALIVTGTGQRVADAFDGNPAGASRLELTYAMPPIGTTTTTTTADTTTTTGFESSTTTTSTSTTIASTTSSTTVPGERVTVEVRVTTSADDAAERASGIVSLTGRELEIVGEDGVDCAAGRHCTNRCECSDDGADPNVRFSADVQPILRRCAPCHGGPAPAQGLNLREPGTYAAMVGAPSTECAGLMLVAPGLPARSYVHTKLEGSGPCFVGSRMPPGNPLTDEELTTITTWIAQGAPAN